MKPLLNSSDSFKGGKLLVPFAGSGTEMIAGMKFGMQAVGFETSEQERL